MRTNGITQKSDKLPPSQEIDHLNPSDTQPIQPPTSPEDINPSNSADRQSPIHESVHIDRLNLNHSTPDQIRKIDQPGPDHSKNDPSNNPNSNSSIVPEDGELLDAILPIRTETPTLGVPKLLLKLKELNPTWKLSEKRLRKFLNNSDAFPTRSRSNGLDHQNGLSNPNLSSSNLRSPCEPMWLPNYAWEKDWEAASAENSPSEPISSLDDTLLLECRQRSVKIEPVRFTASNKGSGLIAKDFIHRGTQILKEDAFVWVPPTKSMSRSVMSGQSCAFCGRAFSMQRTKSQPSCPHHPAPGSKEAIAAQQSVVTTSTSLMTGGKSVTEKPAGPEPCYMRYCTRVCAQRSIDFYGPLVCPQKNPEYMQLLRFTDAEDFRGAHMVFKLFARMLIANETGEISPNPSFKPVQEPKEIPSSHPEPPHNLQNGSTKRHPLSESHDQNGSDDPVSMPGTKKSKKAKSKKKSTINQTPPSSGPSVKFEEIVSRIGGLATISDRARREKFHGNGHLGSHFADVRYGQMWRSGWHTVIKALHINTGYRPSSTDSNDSIDSPTNSFWAKFWKRRLDPDSIAHYFGLKSFLEFIGKASLNREVDHGLYLLHSRFNHSCNPNAFVVKHPGSEDLHKSAPSTLYVVSRRDISKDEEITLAYVDPELCLEARRRKLFEDYLFSCFCSRCRKELEQEEEREHTIELMNKYNRKLNINNPTSQNDNNQNLTTSRSDLHHSLNHDGSTATTATTNQTENGIEDDRSSCSDMGFSCF